MPTVNHPVAKAEKVAKVYNQVEKFESVRLIGIDLINIPSDGPITSDVGDIEALFTVPYNAISNNLESLKNNGQLTIQPNQSNVQLPVIDTAPFKYNKENIVFLDLTAFLICFLIIQVYLKLIYQFQTMVLMI